MSKLNGSDYFDFKLANELAGLNILKTKGYTWHHLDDFDPVHGTCTMQLVETKFHIKTNPHFGSVEIVKQFFGDVGLYTSRIKLKKIKL